MADSLKDAYILTGSISGTLWIISVTFLIFVAQDQRKQVTNNTATISVFSVVISNAFFLAMLTSILSLIPKAMWGEVAGTVDLTAVLLGVVTTLCTIAASSWMDLLMREISIFRKARIVVGTLVAVGLNLSWLIGFLVMFHMGDFGIRFTLQLLALGCVCSIGIALTLVVSASAERVETELPQLRRRNEELRRQLQERGIDPGDPPR